MNVFGAECPIGTGTAPLTKESCQAVTGCVFITTEGGTSTCTSCTANGFYRDKTKDPYKCTPCGNGPEDENRKKCGDEGAACYYTGNGGDSNTCPWKMTCPNKPEFEHGTWKPDSETITYNDTGNGTVPSCTYTNPANVTCNTSGGVCDMGYYFNGLICTEVASISNSGSTLTINTPAPAQLYVSACTDENFVLNEKYNCNNKQYGTCVPQSISCSQSVNTNACSDDGRLPSDDTANWDSTSGKYDFSTCHCIYEQDIEDDNGTIIGKKEKVCSYDKKGENATDCDNWEIVGCDPGYCGIDLRNGTPSTNGNDATCMLAPRGYYNGAPISYGPTSATCYKCPAGATTPGEGATLPIACKYTGATVFQDTAGTSFRLPITDMVTSVDWSWRESSGN